MKSTIDAVIHILNSEELKQPSRLVERREQIEQVIRQRLNCEDMAKQALGWRWIELSDSERQECVALFVRLLRELFAGRIDSLTAEDIMKSCRQGQTSRAVGMS